MSLNWILNHDDEAPQDIQPAAVRLLDEESSFDDDDDHLTLDQRMIKYGMIPDPKKSRKRKSASRAKNGAMQSGTKRTNHQYNYAEDEFLISLVNEYQNRWDLIESKLITSNMNYIQKFYILH